MFAPRGPWVEKASVVVQLQGLLEDARQAQSSSIDPELFRSLLERRRNGQRGRDRDAMQAADMRLIRLHRMFPEIEAEESELLQATRAALMGNIEKA